MKSPRGETSGRETSGRESTGNRSCLGVVAGDFFSGVIAAGAVVTLEKLRWRIRGSKPQLVDSVRSVWSGITRPEFHCEALKYYEQFELVLLLHKDEVDIENFLSKISFPNNKNLTNYARP